MINRKITLLLVISLLTLSGVVSGCGKKTEPTINNQPNLTNNQINNNATSLEKLKPIAILKEEDYTNEKYKNYYETNNIKTYKSEEYGFEFKYPELITSWNGKISNVFESKEGDNYFNDIKCSNDTIFFAAFYDPNAQEALISICVFNKNKNIKDIILEETKSKTLSKEENIKKIKLNNIDAYILKDDANDYISSEIFFENNKYIFEVRGHINNYDASKNITSDPITSSFKLTSILEEKPIVDLNENDYDTSGRETYKNEKYGFEFKYPKIINFEYYGKKSEGIINTDGPRSDNKALFNVEYLYEDPVQSLIIPGFSVYVYNKNNKTFNDFIFDDYKKNNNKNKNNLKTKTILINKKEGLIYEDGSNSISPIFFESDKYFYILSNDIYSPVNGKIDNWNTEIASTFRLTP